MEWKAKCLEVSGNLRNFALNESKTVRQPFLRLTRTTIFMRGCKARCTCQLETGTGLKPTRPIDCVRGASHVVIRWFYDRAPAFMNLGLRRSFIKRRSNMRGSPILIISEYVVIARCHSKSESIRIA